MSQAQKHRLAIKPLREPVTFLTGLHGDPYLSVRAEFAYGPLPMVVQLRQHRIDEGQLRELLVRNPRDAARWISAAAHADLIAAQVVWGQLLLDGRGTTRDPVAAFRWFQKAAAAGDAEAHNMVGRCYEQGWGVTADPQRATAAFALAAQAGHVWGQVNLAQMLVRAGDPADRPRCFALFKAVAESGTTKPHLKAMNSLARFLEEGWAGSPDPASAAYWYLKAANLGDHWAQFNLATILFRQGHQTEADRWLHRAIDISDNGFRRRIAALLLTRPERVLRHRGLDALARCADGNAPDDLYAYGLALAEGVAGTPDLGKAAEMFKTAAAQGHAQAARRVRSGSRFDAIRRLAARALTAARHFRISPI